MKYTKWVRGVRGPTSESFTPDVTIILVSLAGYGGNRTRFRRLARELKLELDVPGRRRVAPVIGVGRLTTAAEQKIASNIRAGVERITKAGGAKPKIIFLGKSMGGRVLSAASLKLNSLDIDVELFVGVDVSCRLGYHYQNYLESRGNTKYAVCVGKNIRELVNLYERRRKCSQNGHVLLYHGTRSQFPDLPYFDRSLNIDVAKDGFNKKNLVLDETCDAITPNNPTHKTIEEDPHVIDVVKRYAWRTAGTV
jgi:hypothetical protein